MEKQRYLLLSLNPGYDRWLEIASPSPFERVYRADSVRVVASGKAINVARCFTRMGFSGYTGLSIEGGEIGTLLGRALAREGLLLEPFRIQDETRVNVTALLTYRKDTLTLNEPGPRILPEETAAFLARYRALLEECPDADVVVSGSAPVGFATQDYLSLLDAARLRGRRLIVDIGGQWLIDSVRGPIDTLKINREEFSQAFGFDPWKDSQRVRAFAAEHHIDTIIITDGVHGSVAFDMARGTWHARFDPTGSGAYAVGSGDSYLAGYLIARARGDALPDSLREATAFGMANTRFFEPGMIDPDTVRKCYRFITVDAGG